MIILPSGTARAIVRASVAVALSAALVQAQTRAVGPRFDISVPKSAHAEPITGRVYVAISRLTDTSGTPIARSGETGDPLFDDTLRQGLSVELQQSPFLSLISDQRAQQTLGLMGQPKDTRLTAEVAKQICERTTSASVPS